MLFKSHFAVMSLFRNTKNIMSGLVFGSNVYHKKHFTPNPSPVCRTNDMVINTQITYFFSFLFYTKGGKAPETSVSLRLLCYNPHLNWS